MTSAILWLLFIAYIIYLSRSKKYKSLYAECREEGMGYGKCLGFFFKWGLIALFAANLAVIVIAAAFDAYDDSMSSFAYTLFAWAVGIFLISFVLRLGYDEDGKRPDRQEKSGKPSEKRPQEFYIFLILPIAVVLGYFFNDECLAMKHILTYFPLSALISAILFSIIVGVSNSLHNIGLNDVWSKAAIVYWFVVAIPFPYFLALRVGYSPHGSGWAMAKKPFWTELYRFDETTVSFCSMLFAGLGFILFYFIIGLFYKLIGGQDFSLELDNSTYTPSSTRNVDSYSYDEEEESSSGWFHSKGMTNDYYGKHGEFDINDEARRVSEDIQQFHNTFPDADLTDQYYWDDVLDAETDGYLDKDDD